MLGNSDHEVLADEPVNAEDLFGEADQPLLPPLSPLNDLEGAASEGNNDNENNEKTEPQKKRRQINRLPNLNDEWLTNPRMEGIYKVNNYFESLKYKKGKGREQENLKIILQRYEYWAHQCYPKLCFSDFVHKVELLSGKRKIKHALQEIRNNLTENNNNNGGDDEDSTNNMENDNIDPFAGDSNSTGNNILKENNEEVDAGVTAQNVLHAQPPEQQVSPKISEEMREMIRRKREEAIAKRKRKLEESMTDETHNINEIEETTTT
ncbi:TIMELESS-interacting protein-like [Hydractinia symbiolongicarpus]|uniref:TIMELESS-interacting protein-like n=1 Tax=Hydractinia symbiolongicarpus TaxID=13093 RepID=UPI00254BCF5B|nr:TIMELESS-interacting protein-like [Hydractinia symbiolongicarpus]